MKRGAVSFAGRAPTTWLVSDDDKRAAADVAWCGSDAIERSEVIGGNRPNLIEPKA